VLTKTFIQSAVRATLLGITIISTAYGHVTVQPKESAPGATERYALRVPTEKFTPTVRVEVEFPAALEVSSFEPKAGWNIEEKKDASGKLLGVVLTGSIPTGESAVFSFTGKSPAQEGKLLFKAIQIYGDGTKSEWTGAEGTRTPAPAVTVKRPAAQ
jgi:uncharacterized protein YcnI